MAGNFNGSLASEKCDLAFDTEVLRSCGDRYYEIAEELTTLAEDLDTALSDLKDTSWTTDAGKAFYDMVDTNWKSNIGVYANLLCALRNILYSAANSYEELEKNSINTLSISGSGRGGGGRSGGSYRSIGYSSSGGRTSGSYRSSSAYYAGGGRHGGSR